MTSSLFHGSCLCGGVRYEVSHDIRAVSHCHCSMCRKTHGAAFATYGSALREHFRFTAGEALLSRHVSSATVRRSFCSVCGTPLLWEKSDGPYADWVAFPLATLDTPVRPLKQKHIHVASKAPWFDIHDDWPQHEAS